MIKTQVQLPNHLYLQAKAIAEQREWSLAEVIRRGIEYMTVVYPVTEKSSDWKLPALKPEMFVADFDRVNFKGVVETDESRVPP